MAPFIGKDLGAAAFLAVANVLGAGFLAAAFLGAGFLAPIALATEEPLFDDAAAPLAPRNSD